MHGQQQHLHLNPIPSESEDLTEVTFGCVVIGEVIAGCLSNTDGLFVKNGSFLKLDG